MADEQSGRPVLGRLGRYVLVDRLGAGGMAEVFRALALGPEQFQRVVVVKRILPQFSAKPSFVQMFIDEARLCGRLSHPNIIQVYEFGSHDDRYFLTMEYVDGRSLGHILHRLYDRKERMPPLIAAEIIRQVCRGLAYAHALHAEDGKPLGIIHRDLSPANLIVGYNGAVKVLDFGIARVESRFRVGRTDPGFVKGKSAYLAPEQMVPTPLDHRADIFTIGIVLHEMLAGERLFKGETAADSVQKIRTMHVLPPSQRNPDVPPRLDAIVLRALRRQREERYQHASEMADALEGCLLEHRLSSQELPSFMRGLFGSEIGNDQIHFTHDELQALTGEPAPATPRPPEIGSSQEEPPAAPDLGDEEEKRAGPSRGQKMLLVAAGLTTAAALAFTFRPVDRVVAPARSPAPAAAAAPAAPAAPATPVAAARAPAPPEAPPTAPTAVKISIGSQPPGATVFEGDSALGATPLVVSRPRGAAPILFRLKKSQYMEGQLNVIPDADKAATALLAKTSARRRNARSQKVRNAQPIDPFAQ